MVTTTTTSWNQRHQLLDQYCSKPTMTLAEFVTEIYKLFCKSLEEMGQIKPDTDEAELQDAFARLNGRPISVLHQIARGEVVLPPDVIKSLADRWSFSIHQAERLTEATYSSDLRMPRYNETHTARVPDGGLPTILKKKSGRHKSVLATEEYRSERQFRKEPQTSAPPQPKAEARPSTSRDPQPNRRTKKAGLVPAPSQRTLEAYSPTTAEYSKSDLPSRQESTPVHSQSDSKNFSGQAAHYNRLQAIRSALSLAIKNRTDLSSDQSVIELAQQAKISPDRVHGLLIYKDRSIAAFKILAALGRGEWLTMKERRELQHQLQLIENKTAQPRMVTTYLQFVHAADQDRYLAAVRDALRQALAQSKPRQGDNSIAYIACLAGTEALKAQQFLLGKLHVEAGTLGIEHTLLSYGWLDDDQKAALRQLLDELCSN